MTLVKQLRNEDLFDSLDHEKEQSLVRVPEVIKNPVLEELLKGFLQI